MKKIIFFFVLAIQYAFVSGQTVTSSVLSQQEISKVFPENVCRSLDISFPIIQVHHYSDQSGSYYCVLTESRDGIFEDQYFGGTTTLNRRIKAVNLKEVQGEFFKQWEINDFIINNKNEEEISVWFWKKYLLFNDADGDGLVDPILVYGTRNNFNYTGNGRVKILIFHKGKKSAIRHQGGVLDGERETQIDPSFYKLSPKLQDVVKKQMAFMETDQNTYFPRYWEKQMKKKKLLLTE